MLVFFQCWVQSELLRARQKHPVGFHSHHEAFGVLYEELAKYFHTVVLREFPRLHHVEARKALVQLAAMCQRAAEDLEIFPRVEGVCAEIGAGMPEFAAGAATASSHTAATASPGQPSVPDAGPCGSD